MGEKMSIKHRMALALSKADLNADYSYSTFTAGNVVNLAFEQPRSAAMVTDILRTIFKRPALIHKGRKP